MPGSVLNCDIDDIIYCDWLAAHHMFNEVASCTIVTVACVEPLLSLMPIFVCLHLFSRVVFSGVMLSIL